MGKNILENNTLAGFNNIFKSTTNRVDGESITYISLSELHPPEVHPFKVRLDESMERLVNNIKKHGVREPGLARPRPDGGYELIAGNRRKMACELAGLLTLPVIIREMDNDSAALAMVDSNLEQREQILFSERALAYKVKMQALSHKGVKDEKQSVEILMEQTGESRSQIFRFLRIAELAVELSDKLDSKQLSLSPAVELSHLSISEQKAVASAMDIYEIKPSLSQAIRLKKLKQAGELTEDMIDEILSESKSFESTKEDKAISQYRKYFPPDYTAKQINEIINGLLQKWQSKQALEA